MQLQEVLCDQPDHVVTLPPKTSLTQASAMMLLERVGAILVCEGARILGILSERDLATAIAVYGPELFGLSIGELMSVDVPQAAPSDSVSEVMRTMTRTRARHMPVVEGEAVVGVVSLGDVRLAEKIRENAALQHLARVRLPS
jgi:CBS domain-containing protein